MTETGNEGRRGKTKISPKGNRTRGELPQFLKKHLQKFYRQHSVHDAGENNAFPLRLGARQRCSFSQLFEVVAALASARKIKNINKQTKGIQMGTEELKLSLFARDLITYVKIPTRTTQRLE